MVKKRLIILAIFFLSFLLSINIIYARQTIVSEEKLFRIDLVKVDPSPVAPGGSADIWFELFNLKDTPLYNTGIDLVAPFPFSTNQSSTFIGSLDPGASTQFKFTVNTNKDVPEGIYNLSIQYTSPESNIVHSDAFGIMITKTGVILTPVSVDVEPKEISPGNTGTITIDFKNTANSALRDIDIKLDLSNSSAPIAPSGSTADQKIKKLDQGNDASVNFNIVVSPKADADVYKIPLVINYYDDLGNLYTVNDVVGVVVNSKAQFQVNLEDTNIYGLWNKGKATISVSNKAPVEVKFVNVQLLNSNYYKILSSPSVYIGNIQSDDFNTIDYDLYPVWSKDGKIPLNILITYKDAYNNELQENDTIYIPTYTYFGQVLYGVTNPTGVIYDIIFIIIIIFLYYVYKNWKETKSIRKAFAITMQDSAALIRKPINKIKKLFK